MAGGLMKVAQGLEVVERGLDEERQARKDDIATLTGTLTETMTLARTLGETMSDYLMNSATVKMGEDLSFHPGISNASTADEISDCEPHKSDISGSDLE
jgi:hypothetical protein